MAAKKKILLAGESWVTTATHIKGFDQFPTVTFHRGADGFLDALKKLPVEFTYMPCHEAQTDFPATVKGLKAYDAIILSDIGANTLLLHPDTWIRSQKTPNRLFALERYVAQGGGLAMIGGYLSFQGINGAARFRGTPVEAALPVTIHPFDDRVEAPEGMRPEAVGDHPILAGVSGEWPEILGFNEVEAKPDATVLAQASATYRNLPIMAVRSHGKGRSLVWTSDIGPHWLPADVLKWKHFARLWGQALGWLCGA
ncbi:MAG: glutamine amidotransferase [Alphaproteobacteria bacterium]